MVPNPLPIMRAQVRNWAYSGTLFLAAFRGRLPWTETVAVLSGAVDMSRSVTSRPLSVGGQKHVVMCVRLCVAGLPK